MTKKCNNCDATDCGDVNKPPLSVPFVVHESMMQRAERSVKRMWILIIVLALLLVGSNVGWLIYESQFEVVETTEIIQENADGYNNYIGNDGDINNGETNDTEN